MAVATGTLTYDDLCRAREDGNRYELIDGELIVIAGPSPKHQWTSGELFVAFREAVTKPGLGLVFMAPLDVHLGGHQYVQPDLVVVLNERSAIVGAAMIEGAPDLLVEIASPSSRARDRGRKLALYAETGVREYWFVDPQSRSVTVHAEPAGDRYQRVERAEDVARSVVVPGLSVDLASLFATFPSGR